MGKKDCPGLSGLTHAWFYGLWSAENDATGFLRCRRSEREKAAARLPHDKLFLGGAAGDDANFFERNEAAVEYNLLLAREVVCSQRFPLLVVAGPGYS